MNYRHKFEEHPAKKGRCPKCGKPNVFRYYAGMPHEFGKCERINDCGHHRKPENSDESSNFTSITPPTKLVRPTLLQISQFLSDLTSHFHRYCIDLGIPLDHLAIWGVGTSNECTVFMQTDRDQSPVNIKFIHYSSNGHRNKDRSPHYLKSELPNEKYGQCLYGLHLLRDGHTICLVESEKTAVIASYFYPEFDWLATGGSNGLTAKKLDTISNSRLIYIGDSDKAGRSNSSIKCLISSGMDYQILNLFEDKSDGYDLADAIADGHFPIIEPKTSESKKLIVTEDTFLDHNGNISRTQFIDFLNDKMGFHTFRYNESDKDVHIVRVENGIVDLFDLTSLKQTFMLVIENFPDLREKFLRSVNQLFGPNFLTTLPLLNQKFLCDTKNTAWFAFQNCLVSISADEIKVHEYSKEHLIFRSSILKHDFKLISRRAEITDFEFFKFLRNISGSYKRQKSLISAIGYILHDCHNECKAVILTDSSISDEPEGRTGKSLLSKALGKVRNSTEIDGKEFKVDNRFRFQSVTPHTQIINFNDVGQNRKAFDLEQLFTVITEGAPVEQKGNAPFLKKAKILISSNRPVKVDGGSARARAFEFELSNYYSEKHSPRDEFGHYFFDDWSEHDWNLFYNIKMLAVQIYLKHGLIETPTINLELRKLMFATTKDSTFVDFAKEEILPEIKYDKRELLQKFKTYNPGYDNLHPRTFTGWISKFAKFKGYDFEESHSGVNLYFIMVRK